MTALDLQADWCRRLGSPLYAGLLARCAHDARDEGNLRTLLAPHSAEPLGSALALRLMAAVHRLTLEGSAPALAAHYPSCGGDGNIDAAWNAFRDTISVQASRLAPMLAQSVQTNEVDRAAALLGGFLTVWKRHRLALRVLEIGTSAGLNLRWDHFRYECDDWCWGPAASPVRLNANFIVPGLPFADEPVAVSERCGCDLTPIDATSEGGRLALRSYVWADRVDRLERLDAACAVAGNVPASIDRANAVDWLRVRAMPQPGVATILFHSVFLQYVTSHERERLQATIEEAGRAATRAAPFAHLFLEPRSDDNVVLRSWPGGTEELLAHATLHGREVRWHG